MVNEKFEAIISNHKWLNLLLTKNTITVFGNFSSKNFNEEGFKEYIAERYEKSFRDVFEANRHSPNEGVITSLFRSSKFLATDGFNDKITLELRDVLEVDLLRLQAVKHSYDQAKKTVSSFEDYLLSQIGGENPVSPVLSNKAISIIIVFGNHSNIKELKNSVIALNLDICDFVADARPKREMFKYAVYNSIMDNLKKIKDFGSLKERFEAYDKKINKKRSAVEVKYVIGIVITIVLLLLRFLSRMDR